MMECKVFFLILSMGVAAIAPLPAVEDLRKESLNAIEACGKHACVEHEAQAAFRYLLDEVELDEILSFEAQQAKVQEFKNFAQKLSPKVAARLTQLLLEETRVRILDILQDADLEPKEIDYYLADYAKAVKNARQMDVELARQMLFFVAELKIHKQYVYDFGVLLGCPEKQLLRHDLCKLSVDQFEGYARYFRGGRSAEDRLGYLAAWELHQHEEHHHECYHKGNIDTYSDDQLRNNMLESVADILAASKQRGGGPLLDWLINVLPKKNLHPRLLPFLQEGLIKAHGFYLEGERNPDSEYAIFRGLPCWNSALEKIFAKLKK